MTIWYDISGIYNWRGNFTGIQRVVYNLGKELDGADQKVKFFIYHAGRFSEVTFADLDARLVELNKISTSMPATGRRITVGKLHHHSMLLLKRSVRNTPLEAPLRTVYGGLRTGYRQARKNTVRTAATYSHPFAASDVVVVVDGNWQFPGYADALQAAKAKDNFKLFHFVHDMVAVKNPALASPKADQIIGGYFKKVFTFADGLIAISESTKRDTEWFIDSLQLTHRPIIKVVREGDGIDPEKQTEPTPPNLMIPEPFIFAVSTIEIRKNYTALYYSYKLALEQGTILPHLVIAGRKGWLADEAFSLLTKDPELKPHVTILQGPDDHILEWLYEHCTFTIFPSFYEGWGLPIAESLHHGKACIGSHASSLPEVGGELVRYVSPYNPAEIVTAITELMDPGKRAVYEKKIQREYRPYSWRQSCQDLLAAVQ